MTTIEAPRVGSPSRLARWSGSLRVGPTAAVIGAVGGLVSWLGSWNPSYWGDEAATISSADRPIAQLFAELGRIDAVHGVYYLGMHVWIQVFGISELSVRAPSAIAVGFLIAGTVVLGSRLAGLRYGILAGVVVAVLPRTTYLATEARSYAISAALAVWITVFFVGLLRRRETRLRPWLLLGAFVGLSSYLFLYLVLLVAVFGAVVLSSSRYRVHLVRWVQLAAVAALLTAPIGIAAFLPRSQLSYLAHSDYANPYEVLVTPWFGYGVAVPIVALLLIALGLAVAIPALVRRSARPVLDNRGSDLDVLRLAGAWAVVPLALLMVGNALSPIYNDRYPSFCVPAAALLVALGMVALGRVVARLATRLNTVPTRSTRITAVVAIVAALGLAAAALPGYVEQRGAYAKNGGSDWRAVADYVQSHAVSGDAVVFDVSPKPSQKPELSWRLYPSRYAAVTAPQVTQLASTTSNIWDTVAPIDDVLPQLEQASTVWALEFPTGAGTPDDIVSLVSDGYRVVGSQLINRIVVYELQKAAS